MFDKTRVVLDIGNQNIKIVSGGFKNGKIIVNNYAVVKTPANALKDGRLQNPEAIFAVVSNAVKEHKIKLDNIVFVITGTGVLTREIQVPKSSEEEIAGILEYEAQQYFPMDLSNYVMDFKVTEETAVGEDEYSKLLLVAVPESQIEEYMKANGMLGKTVEAIDIPANTISKLLFPPLPVKGQKDEGSDRATREKSNFAILDFGSDTVTVSVFNRGILKFNRIILTGSRDIDTCIADFMGISHAEGEKIKMSLDEAGESVESDNEIKGCVKRVLLEIFTEVNRFIEFCNTRNPENRVSEIYLCGGGGLTKGLHEEAATVFSSPMKHLKVLGHVEYKGTATAEEFERDFPLLACAIGGLVRQ